MLVEQIEPYFEAQPHGYDAPATFFLTINKTKGNNTWSAGYQDFHTGMILLGINDADTLEEVAIRLAGRLQRYRRNQLQRPRTLRDLPKSSTVNSANLTEGITMSDSNKSLSHGQKLVGVNFNPSQDPNVARLKELAAEQIDLLEKIHNDRLTAAADSKADYDTNTVHGEAIRRVMDAQMWTVKDATWKPENAVPAQPADGAAANDGDTSNPLNQDKTTAKPAEGGASGDDATAGNNAQ